MSGDGGGAAGSRALSVSDRVVWLGSLGTRLGTVRWLGELPELRPGPTVGIELVSGHEPAVIARMSSWSKRFEPIVARMSGWVGRFTISGMGTTIGLI